MAEHSDAPTGSGPPGSSRGPLEPIRSGEGGERTLEEAIEAMEVGYQLLDSELRYLYLNGAACRQGQRERDSLLGQRLTDVYPGLGESGLVRALERVIESGVPERILNEFPLDDGEVGWFQLFLQPVGGGVAVLSLDVTQRFRAESEARRLRQELAGSQRLDAIGRLAARVAHDYNNTLQVILGNAEEIERIPQLSPEVGDAVADILAAARSAAELNRQLLRVGRVEETAPQPIELGARIRGLEGMIRRLVGPGIRVETTWAPESLIVLVDPCGLDHVVLNLVANAREAMPRGGRLGLETRVVEIEEDAAEKRPEVMPGRYAVLAVSDTGIGMDEETRGRIFEPFFSTRSAAGGSGLGLAGVYGVVRQSGGYIWVYSEPGRGSVFKLHFPLRGGASAPAEGPRQDRQVAATGERILVIEDDAPIRTLFRKVLERAGYRVVAAADAAGLEAMLRDPALRPDLLISDVILPRSSGPEVAARARQILPDLPVLLVSGYTTEIVLAENAGVERGRFVEKPVTPRRLLEAVRRELGHG